ncbi:MAG: lactate racemase domain-containing protein, partial [Aminivibrio sp.]
MAKITFPYEGFGDVEIPNENLIAVLAPKTADLTPGGDMEEARRALENPIGSPRLKEMVKKGDSALIIIDDNTRNTPAAKLLPLLFEELEAGGVTMEDSAILIALGTHRAMTDEEVKLKVGADLLKKIRVFQHDA